MKITEMSRTRLRRLLKAFRGTKNILVLTHDYPENPLLRIELERVTESLISAER